ncbi:CMRF35-like molecule 5 isoform 3-T3 [Clarias gariepinus]
MEMVLIFTFSLILASTDAVTTVTGYRGRSVQVKCPYTSRYEDYNKYLCRGKCPTWDLKDVPVQSGSPVKDPRFSLYDDTTAKVFTVTITDLRPEDGGTYWCGIDKTGRDIYTEILLLVKMANPQTDVNFSTTARPSQGFPTLTVIISVSVVLALVLFALLFTVTLQRKKRTRGSETETHTEKNRDGENDKNVAPAQEREKASFSEPVYQSLDPVTKQTDLVYQSLNVTNN